MYKRVKYFSVTEKEGWSRGFSYNFKITDKGLSLLNVKESENKSIREHHLAVFFSTSFDSNADDTIWHKFEVFDQMDEDTIREYQLQVSYFASNNKSYIKRENGQNCEIDDFILDQSIDYNEKYKYLESIWFKMVSSDNPVIINARDALFQNAKGRYMWIRVEVRIDDFTGKPFEINKIRIYYPRMSFLKYLPSIYEEDEESRNFLEKYFSIFSTLYDDMEERIENISLTYDPNIVAGDYLKWLSSWLAISNDKGWNQEKLSKLIKKVPDIYKIRGTRRAIEEMVEIYTGEKPFIIEYFQYKYIDNPKIKELFKSLYGDDPYTFTVIVKSECVSETHQRIALKKILQEEKPAFTEVRLIVLKQGINLDAHSYLGINTQMFESSQMLLDPEKSVLYNNVLDGENDIEI